MKSNMRFWRGLVFLFAAVIICAEFGVPSFTKPNPVFTIVMIVGLAIITCICDATDKIMKKLDDGRRIPPQD